jgi:hypothetical protein
MMRKRKQFSFLPNPNMRLFFNVVRIDIIGIDPAFFRIKLVRTMPAAIHAAVTTAQKELFCENHVSFFRFVEIAGLESFSHGANLATDCADCTD